MIQVLAVAHWYPNTSQKTYFPEKHFPEKHPPEHTLARMYIWLNGHFPKKLFSRIDTCQNVHLAEWTFPRKSIF